MIINSVDPEEVRIAILRGRILEDFDIESRGVEKNKGNIYKGIVMAVEPALGAAFVNYGPDKQGFLTAHDVHPKYAHDGDHEAGGRRIDRLLKPKQTVLVQVSKDEVGSKGAVLTTFLSLAGRYLVLMPDSDTQAVSRKIDDDDTRHKVREAAARLDVPADMGVIIRTAGRDRTKLDLARDLRVLLRLWDNIQKTAAQARAPALIFKEQDVIIRALRDYFSADIDEIVLDSDEAYDRAAEYMDLVMPNHQSALTRYVERRPIFHYYRIEEQLAVIYAPKVLLPSGGSIVIESTEALVAIDVNSGKQKSGNQEETACQTNVEAAVEVARQLRLRDLGGIVVVDFIDMNQRKNQQKVERTLKDALRDDKARVKIGRISRNGTLEVTRQRIRSALGASIFDACAVCGGVGHVLNAASHAIAVMRRLRDRASRGDLKAAHVRVPPEVANRLRTEYWTAIKELEQQLGLQIEVLAEHGFAAGHEDFTFETDPNATPAPASEPNFGPAFVPESDGERPAPTEDDDLDEPSADSRQGQEDPMQRSSSSSRSRHRGGRRGGKHEAGSPAHDGRSGANLGETLAMPSFEMVDLAAVGPPPRRLQADAAPAAASGDGPRRRRRRRGGSGDGAAEDSPRLSQPARRPPAARPFPSAGADAHGGGADDRDRAPGGILSRILSWAKRK